MVSVENAVRAAMSKVDAYALPGMMSQEDALKFYEEMRGELEARIDGLRSDLGVS